MPLPGASVGGSEVIDGENDNITQQVKV